MNERSVERKYDVLLLDFGGVCLLNPVELHPVTETRLGLAPGTLDWLGPVAPDTDLLWQQMIKGDGVTEPQYWEQRARDVGNAAGVEMTLQDYMRMLFDPPTPQIVRPQASDVVRRALAAGYGVSVLTNDMRAFHGPDWEHEVDFLGLVDHVVDCSDTKILKPDSRAFERAIEIVGVKSNKVLFIDAQPLNVSGGNDFGSDSVWLPLP